MYSVSSDFQLAGEAKNAKWVRKFMLGSSDYSAFVNRWPSINKKWDGVAPQTVTIDLSNEGRTFNFLMTYPVQMRNTVTLSMGPALDAYVVDDYVVDDYVVYLPEELLTLFSGTVDAARYNGGACSVTLIDKFKKLTDRKIGDSTTPVNYTSSSYLIHDLAWYACTSLGGLSALSSTNNPDIDYLSWSSWSSVFSLDNVRGQLYLTGQTPLEILRKLSLLAQSAIYIEANKIKFSRFIQVASDYRTLDDAHVIDATATLDDRQLINKAWVSAAYNVTSRSFGITVFDQSSASQSDYGLRENLVAENFAWLTDSVSALNLAQRQIISNSNLVPRFAVRSPLHAMMATIGDPVRFSDSLLQVSDTYRIMGEALDMDSGVKTYDIDQTQFFSGFRLDISALDSNDLLL